MTLVLITHCALYVFVVFFVFRLDKAFSMLSPVFWYLAFHFVCFIVRPLLYFNLDFNFVFNYIGSYPNVEDKILALFIIDIALIFFLVGFYSSRHYFPVRAPLVYITLNRNVYWVAALLLPIVLYSVYKTIGGVGVSDGYEILLEVVDGVAINVNSNGYLNDINKSLGTVILIICVYRKFDKYSLLLVAAFVGYRLFVGWGRIYLVAFFIQVFLFNLYQRRKKWPSKNSILLILIAFPIFSYIGQNRDAVREIFTDQEISRYESDLSRHKLDTLDLGNFEFLSYVVAVVPERSGTYTYWTQYLQLITEPIPRSLWVEKPIGAPIKLVNLMDYGNFNGLTVSVIGDAWISLGYLGVVVNLLLIGMMLSWVYSRFLSSSSSLTCLAYIITLPFLIQLLRDGGVVTIAKFTLFSLLPIILLSLIGKLGKKLNFRRQPFDSNTRLR